ncbi:unnamed protein product [Arabidopsis halleri]|nr:ORF118A protein [Turritis glabra]
MLRSGKELEEVVRDDKEEEQVVVRKAKQIVNFPLLGMLSSARYGLRRWPFTVKCSPLTSQSTTAPYGFTSFMRKGKKHLDLNFPGNNLSLELRSSTWSFTLNSLGKIFLSCQALVLSL